MGKQINLFSGEKELSKDKEKVNALDELFSQSAKYKSSAAFMELLDFINRFPNLSPFNAFLINMQDSAASIVLTPYKWIDYGRRVRPLSRPFIIMVPFGPVAFVYNITDTDQIIEGEDKIPESMLNPFKTTGYLNPQVYHYTYQNSFREGIVFKEETMQRGGAGYAMVQKDGKFIVKINDSYGINEKYSTLVHELAHIYCGHLGASIDSWWKARGSLSKDIMEIEAESVSYLVCRRLGLKSTAMKYLSNYIINEKQLPAISIETILTVSLHIEKMWQKGFKPKKNNKYI